MVINELKQKYTITAILKVVDIPRSTYYYYCKQLEKPDRYAEVKAEMKQIWEECSENYGYRRMTKELRKKDMYQSQNSIKAYESARIVLPCQNV